MLKNSIKKYKPTRIGALIGIIPRTRTRAFGKTTEKRKRSPYTAPDAPSIIV